MMRDVNESFSEVLDILNHMETKLYNKIPKSFINLIEQNKDLNYNVNIDYSKNINQQNLLKGTRIILSLIYRDYIVSSDKKKELLQRDIQEEKRIEEEKRVKYNLDKIFERKKRDIFETQSAQENTQMIKVEEKWYHKILNRIKEIFISKFIR